MRIIKAYQQLVETYRETPQYLSYDEDLAVAKFRGFFVEASLMVQRVDNRYAIAVMKEILQTLQDDLAEK